MRAPPCRRIVYFLCYSTGVIVGVTMSSGFVSGGTNEEPLERDDEWQRVQQQLEEERKRKADLDKQDDGRTLFDVLQQNKMAKQEAFEEKIKLKNQFRSLDEDEVDFLDSVLESTRAQEAAVQKDTADQLEVFRRQREEAEKTLLEDTAADVAPAAAEGEEWKIPSRKRRREKKDTLLPGKKRKSTADSAGEDTQQQPEHKEDTSPVDKPKTKENSDPVSAGASSSQKDSKPQEGSNNPKDPSKDTTEPAKKQPEPEKPAVSLGLGDYGSDSE